MPKYAINRTAVTAVVMTLYYIDELWASVVGLIISIITAWILNRREAGKIWNLLKSRVGKGSAI